MTAPDPKLGQRGMGGDVPYYWNGYEWVSRERYEEQRAQRPELPALLCDDEGCPHHGTAHVCVRPLCPYNHPAGSRCPACGVGGRYAPQAAPAPAQAAPATTLQAPSPGGPLAAMYAPRPPKVPALQYVLGSVLAHLDPDHRREGLVDTPARAAKAWAFWTSGYDMDPAEVLKCSSGADGFADGAERYDEMVMVRNIPVYSKCEHHLADIFGYATIAYIPDGKVVGLSKLNRLVEVYARRLQVQERMTAQIADALMEHLAPIGCGVCIVARHMCMESRGVRHNSHTVTSIMRGAFKDNPTTRAEFLALAKETRHA